jgi:phosphatidylserine/phosphatidylglycerophosphate/cardiolipin synthase-like enzyme
VALPEEHSPVQFYSNQTRHDIKRTFHQAIKKARNSIFLSVYGVTDPQILALLTKKAEAKIPISVEYDAAASSNLKKILPSSVHVRPIKSKGLMHRKILVLDQSLVFLGSANLTPTSLRHHNNLVLGLYSPALALFLENPSSTSFAFDIQERKGEIFLLPDPEKTGLLKLIETLNEAKQKITIAMFTLTQSQIAEALIAAQRRGVAVTIAIDYYTSRGASKKTLRTLEKEGVKILLSQGKELLHHKWALIDEKTLILGSANWTQAAFTKNHDFLLFLYSLDKKQKQFLNHLWEIIIAESIPKTDAVI